MCVLIIFLVWLQEWLPMKNRQFWNPGISSTINFRNKVSRKNETKIALFDPGSKKVLVALFEETIVQVYVEPFNKTIVASTDLHCIWLSVLTWTSVIWIYDFVVNYSVKIRSELILVVAVKASRKLLLLTIENIHVLTLMNA